MAHAHWRHAWLHRRTSRTSGSPPAEALDLLGGRELRVIIRARAEPTIEIEAGDNEDKRAIIAPSMRELRERQMPLLERRPSAPTPSSRHPLSPVITLCLELAVTIPRSYCGMLLYREKQGMLAAPLGPKGHQKG